MPIISVLLPVYNAAKDLPNVLKSLSKQTFTDFEIIAIDDGSTDGSGELLEKCAHKDARIRVFHQENAGALGKVLNRAAELAQGKYLARQDADDLSDASRLHNQVEYFEKHKDIGLCGTWTWFIDTELGPLYSLELPDSHKLLSEYLYKGMNPIVHGSAMMHASVFQQVGGYRGSYSEDFDLWTRLSEISHIGMCQSLGYYYWRNVSGISTGAFLRQRLLTQLAIQLHTERIQYGHEYTHWHSEYQRIIAENATEGNPLERETSMFYARGLALMRFKRYEEARLVFQKAATGQGPSAKKAARNLFFAPIFPLLALAYKVIGLREPIRYAHLLPKGTDLPS
jgi:glycosyltransferase involved in cell wall biosynthesis